jgi:hypothetical protein
VGPKSSVTIMNLVIPKVGAKHKLLFRNRPQNSKIRHISVKRDKIVYKNLASLNLPIIQPRKIPFVGHFSPIFLP